MPMKLYPHQEQALNQTENFNRVKFKPIKGYENLYSISSNGDVVSMYHAITLKPGEKNGYQYVTLYKNKKGKKHYIHRLVAQAFIKNPNKFNEVNHIDSNRKNNEVDNLEWCNRSHNVKHTYDVGGRPSNRETHIGNNYKGISIKVIDDVTSIEFENMKTAFNYLGKYDSYVSERLRRTGSNIIVVSGRQLHEALGVNSRYTTWFERMTEYGFVEGQDFLPNLGKSTGGRQAVDHIIKLDMAKEIAMTQAEFRKWLKIGDATVKYFISKGMPVIRNENGSIRIPRDAVRVWLRDNWQVLA